MIKQFANGDITLRPFGTFKHWTLQSVDTGGLDQYGYGTYYSSSLEVNEGVKLTSTFYPTGSPYYVAENEPINPSGKYARNIYSLTNAMFYEYSGNPLTTFGIEQYVNDPITGMGEARAINDKVITATIKPIVFGDTIQPETIEIVDNFNIHETYNVFDDGYTNLFITGSHFPTTAEMGAVSAYLSTPYWISSSGQFYVTFPSGNTRYVNLQNATYYMDMGFNVTYVPPAPSGSDIGFNQSTYHNYFQANNERFGESISSWYKYIAVGSPMDNNSLSTTQVGYAAIFKYDDTASYHRLVKQFNYPLADNPLNTSSFNDTWGYSVSVRDNFLAIGSPSGSACQGSEFPGFVGVYDKYKGGTDNWGILNILTGISTGDQFGASVSIDNNILAVGAPGASGSGAVYIFRRMQYQSDDCSNIPTGSYWKEIADENSYCEILETESSNGTSSLIWLEKSAPSFVSGNYTWVYEATLTSSVETGSDNFGYCLEACNNMVLIGTNKTGKGYASLFTCSYYSASSGACPTASWAEVEIFRSSPSYGDLNAPSPIYAIDVSSNIVSDFFGSTVSISGNNLVIGCAADKAFIPFTAYTGSAIILGAAYFYKYNADRSCDFYTETSKTFGNPAYSSNNNFGKNVSMSGNTAVVTAWPDKLGRTVDYISGSYILENESYQSTGSQDSVLGRVFIYSDSTGTGSWSYTSDMRRNKETGKPYNIYGYAASVCSDFLCVGGPILNFATASHYAAIVNPGNQTASMAPTYSGSVFVYDLSEYRPNQLIGNSFYKNGYLVMTNTASNYYGIMTGTGSSGFQLTYQGSHMIYEHEYLVSLTPGEFNYSTNPTSLINNPMSFDVNQDGVFDYNDVNLIIRYLQQRQFYNDFKFDDNGLILETDSVFDYSWWGNDLIQTEAEDVLQQEDPYAGNALETSSLSPFTKTVYEFIQTQLVNTGILDIDGDGQINLNDGNILALYCFNMLNSATLMKYLSGNSTKIYVADITTYLNQYCGRDSFAVNPQFLGYQYSSSYDATGSFLAPYITTVGLYDNNELVAVGKLGRPIKSLVDWPINIIVRFDT